MEQSVNPVQNSVQVNSQNVLLKPSGDPNSAYPHAPLTPPDSVFCNSPRALEDGAAGPEDLRSNGGNCDKDCTIDEVKYSPEQTKEKMVLLQPNRVIEYGVPGKSSMVVQKFLDGNMQAGFADMSNLMNAPELIVLQGVDGGVGIHKAVISWYSKLVREQLTNHPDCSVVFIPSYSLRILRKVVEVLYTGETFYSESDKNDVNIIWDCMKELECMSIDKDKFYYHEVECTAIKEDIEEAEVSEQAQNLHTDVDQTNEGWYEVRGGSEDEPGTSQIVRPLGSRDGVEISAYSTIGPGTRIRASKRASEHINAEENEKRKKMQNQKELEEILNRHRPIVVQLEGSDDEEETNTEKTTNDNPSLASAPTYIRDEAFKKLVQSGKVDRIRLKQQLVTRQSEQTTPATFFGDEPNLDFFLNQHQQSFTNCEGGQVSSYDSQVSRYPPLSISMCADQLSTVEQPNTSTDFQTNGVIEYTQPLPSTSHGDNQACAGILPQAQGSASGSVQYQSDGVLIPSSLPGRTNIVVMNSSPPKTNRTSTQVKSPASEMPVLQPEMCITRVANGNGGVDIPNSNGKQSKRNFLNMNSKPISKIAPAAVISRRNLNQPDFMRNIIANKDPVPSCSLSMNSTLLNSDNSGNHLEGHIQLLKEKHIMDEQQKQEQIKLNAILPETVVVGSTKKKAARKVDTYVENLDEYLSGRPRIPSFAASRQKKLPKGKNPSTAAMSGTHNPCGENTSLQQTNFSLAPNFNQFMATPTNQFLAPLPNQFLGPFPSPFGAPTLNQSVTQNSNQTIPDAEAGAGPSNSTAMKAKPKRGRPSKKEAKK